MAKPASWTTDATELAIADSGASRWIDQRVTLGRRLFPNGTRGNAVTAFVYEEEVKPGDSLSIVQYIATCKLEEADFVDRRRATGWSKDIQAYAGMIKKKVYQEFAVSTGDAWVDSSVAWARGILAANAHYLDGAVVPMPCPAERDSQFRLALLRASADKVGFQSLFCWIRHRGAGR